MLRIILTIALACCAPAYGAPIPPGPVGSFVNNSAAPQTAQFNVSSGTVRGKLTAGELAVTTLSVTGVIDGSFEGSGAGLTGIPWAGVIKTGSNLNEITTRDHSVLTSTGVNSHAAIDSHILSSAAVHGSTALSLGSRIVQRDASGNFAAGSVTATSFLGPLTGNATTATTAANIAGGSLGTIPYQTASGTTAMLPAGPFNYVLQGKGAATPTWTSSPTITGTNITGIPLSSLNAGTLPVSIPASSITVTGTQVGTFGGPTQSAQITVGSDGRVRSIVQYPIPGISSTTVMYDQSYTWDKYQNFLSSISVGSIYGDGTNLTGVNDVVARAGVAALDVATTTLTQDLATEISNRQIADAAIGIATGTLRTDLSAETLARGLADAAIGVTTGTLRTDLTTETNNRITGDYNLGVDTTTLYNTKVAKSGDTMTGNLLVGASVQAEYFQGSFPRIDAALSTAAYTTESYANPAWITSLATSKIDLSTATAYADGLVAPINAALSTAAYLGNSQTFTGANEFTGATTIGGTLLPAITGASNYRLTADGAGGSSWQPPSAAAGLTYMVDGASPDIPGYISLVGVNEYIPAARSTTTLASPIVVNTYISSAATNIGHPGATFIPAGTWISHSHMEATNANRIKITMEIYLRTAAGVETDFCASPESDFITTTDTGYVFTCVAVSTAVAPGTRVVRKYKATTISGNVGISIYANGIGADATNARLELPATILEASSYLPISGGTLTGNLLVGASVQANIFQSADPATVHQIWVASAAYAVNGGTGGGVVQSTAVIDGSPIGSIIAYSTTTPPSGYLYCDGSSVSTTTYAALFAVTGYRYGGTGANFSLPDMRGMFLRGAFGNLNSTDPDANRVVGSTQTDTFQGHEHEGYLGTSAPTSGTGYPGTNVGQGGLIKTNVNNIKEAISDTDYGTLRVSVETRPENVAVAYMIKYGHTGSVDISSTALVATSTLTWTGANTYTGSITASSLTATGYSKLGATAPGIKVVQFSTNTWTAEGGSTSITHGLTQGKIVSVTGVVDQPTSIPPGYLSGSELLYSFYWDATKVYLALSSADSGSLLNKPARIFVVYVE